jgi:hypothetical protein
MPHCHFEPKPWELNGGCGGCGVVLGGGEWMWWWGWGVVIGCGGGVLEEK